MVSCWATIYIGLAMLLQATDGQTDTTPGPAELTSGISMTASVNVSSDTSAAPSLVTTSTTPLSPLTISPSPTNASTNGSLNTTAAPSLGVTPDPPGPPELTSGSSMTASNNVSAAPSLVTTSTTSFSTSAISPSPTNASTNGSLNTTSAPSLVTTSTTSLFPLTISPRPTNASTNGLLNTTAAPSLVTNSTTTTGFTFIPLTFSCSSGPPLCCMGLNSSCYRGCFCDVACLRIGDCCSDFTATCVTGFSQPNFTNTTSTNETTFPIYSFSGNCSAKSPMCCSGSNVSCFNGCFCDQTCASRTPPDCCPDYNDICMIATTPTTPPDPQKLIFALSVSFLAPASYNNSTIQTAIEQALSTIRGLLNEGSNLSYKVLKIKLK